jgi:hypothetical protein
MTTKIKWKALFLSIIICGFTVIFSIQLSPILKNLEFISKFLAYGFLYLWYCISILILIITGITFFSNT